MSAEQPQLPGLGEHELLRARLVEVSLRQLDQELVGLYAAHPGLEEAVREAADDCRCCAERDLGERFGYDVAARVGDLRFLMGDRS